MLLPDDHANLDVERRGQPPQRLRLDSATFRIGRAPDSHLHVPEAHVSKNHAELRRELGRYTIVDLGSRAGVLVNGRKVERHDLADGDAIGLGEDSPVRIVFRAPRKVSAPATTLIGVTDPGLGGMARLARFFEFSRKLGGGFSLEEVLRDVVDLAIEVTGAERGMVILGTDGCGLAAKIARGRGAAELPLDGQKFSETLVRQSLEFGKPRVVADVGQDVDLANAQSILSLELRSAVTLPLVRAERKDDRQAPANLAFGVLYLDSRRRRGSFDHFDLGILERLAQDASAVIENARLLREADEKRRIDREILMAREVQAALMPDQFRSTHVFAVAGTCVPCHDLGGDYVDQFDLGGGRQALVVADVCGKGIAASLLAAALQGALAAWIREELPLGEIVARANRVHCRLAPVGKFITLAIAVLEADGTAVVVNAGHCPVLHVHDRGVANVTTDGMALGLDEDASFRSATVRLAAGDTLVLYTDGVVEAEGPGRELFGDERLAQLLAQQRRAAAPELVALVTDAVAAFRRGEPVSDDLTVLVARRL